MGPVDINELRAIQLARARMRNELLLFFHGEWFNFLFVSAVTKTTKDKMFRVLGIPAREVT